MRAYPSPNTMPGQRQRQSAQRPTRLVTQTEAARIIGVKRQNLGPWAAKMDAEEHAGRLFFTRASAERVRDERAAHLADRSTATAAA